MSETKFTEGEWVFEQSPEWQIVAVSESGKDTLMCNMTYYPWNSYNIYDWYLIAAAPDMDEAIEYALFLLWSNDFTKAVGLVERSVFDKLKAAQKKARGDHATD